MSDQWTYIWMAYGATWAVLAGYYLHVRRRLRRAELAARDEIDGDGRMR